MSVKKARDRLLRVAQEATKRVDVSVLRWSESNYLLPHLARVLRSLDIDVVVDVGANAGQTVQELRGLGFRGQIVSFEPTPHLFVDLERRFRSDPHWRGYQLALGDEPGELTLIEYAESSLNSFRRPTAFGASRFRTLAAEPVGEVTVRVERLSSIWDTHVPSGRVLLKVDTQGFDLAVLRGAADVLPSVDAVVVELPVNPIYEQAPVLVDYLGFLTEQFDFEVTGMFPIKRARNRVQLVELDGVFVSSAAVSRLGP